jgi:hypothetical protein
MDEVLHVLYFIVILQKLEIGQEFLVRSDFVALHVLLFEEFVDDGLSEIKLFFPHFSLDDLFSSDAA